MTTWIDPIDVAFMQAVGWSEQRLADIEAGWEPPCNAAALRKVRHDAMLAIAADIPDPAAYAAFLTPEIAAALMDAVHGRNGGLWAADGPLVPVLRSLGLIAIQDRQLTGFAMEVRRALRILAGETVPPRKTAQVRDPATRSYSSAEMGHTARGRRNPEAYRHDYPLTEPADLTRVESSAPCKLCGCRPDACECRRARA